MKTLFPRAIALSVLLMMVLAVFSAPNTAAKKGTPTTQVKCSAIDDATLAANVLAKISKTPALQGQDIKVEAKAGVVTLKGTISSSINRTFAARTASSVSCVKRVANSLVVKRPISSDTLCCCDGICWQQTARCPMCGDVTTCVEDYKSAVAAAAGNKAALIAAKEAFETCRCKQLTQ